MPLWLVPALALLWAVATTIIAVGLRLWQSALEDRLRTEIAKQVRQAKHDAINEMNVEIGKLTPRDVHDGREALHAEQMREVRRRLEVLEQRHVFGPGAGA